MKGGFGGDWIHTIGHLLPVATGGVPTIPLYARLGLTSLDVRRLSRQSARSKSYKNAFVTTMGVG